MTPQEAILRESDYCVMCGMCLPHCPTWRLSGNEADSPRGRIMLMQGLARGQLEPDNVLMGHLDGCLSCRACEAMCPSRVPYTRLLGHARRLTHRESRGQRWLRALLTRGELMRRLQRLYRFSGLRGLLRAGGVLKLNRATARLDALLPDHAGGPALAAFHPARGSERGRVALFTGCTGSAFDAPTLRAAIDVLTRFGFGVHVPGTQACCGAMHQQAGDQAGFERLARANLEAFNLDVEAIVYVASGCGATLGGYTDWLEGAEGFTGRLREISDFLADRPWPDGLQPRPLTLSVAVHIPCSQARALHCADAGERLLRRIPGLELQALAENDRCCGAGGMHMLTRAEQADALRAPKLAALAGSGAGTLVTTNVGCALHLAGGIRQQGLQVEVTHPVVLLQRQLAPGACSAPP